MAPHPTTYRIALVAALVALAACSQTTGTDGSERADDTTQSSTSLAPLSPTSIEALETADAFYQARTDYDIEATLGLLAPDAAILDLGLWRRTPDEYPALFEWMASLKWNWELIECNEATAGPPVRLICTHDLENAWSRAQGSEPVRADLELLIENGHIIEVNHDLGLWTRTVWKPWFDWLMANHPDDVEVMFRFDDEGTMTGGPATTAESLVLYTQHTSEYVQHLTTTGN